MKKIIPFILVPLGISLTAVGASIERGNSEKLMLLWLGVFVLILSIVLFVLQIKAAKSKKMN